MRNIKTAAVAAVSALIAVQGVFAQDSVQPDAANTAAPVSNENITLEMESPASVSADVYVDIASGYIDFDGCVISDSLVIQPGFDVYITPEGWSLPVELGFWGNYATDKMPDQTQNHAFTEVDACIGTSYEWEDSGVSLSFALNTVQYPNLDGWNGEEYLSADLKKTFADVFPSAMTVALGVYGEYALSGDCDNNVNALTYLEAAYEFTKDLSTAVRAQFHYLADEGGEDGWGNFSVRPSITFREFSVFAQYFVQMDDKVYTDEMNDLEDFIYGAGYAVSF